MSILKIGKCAICGKLVETVPTNNPIGSAVCPKCLARNINARNLEQANFFCRTYNIPFKPELWTELVEKLGAGEAIFAAYVERWTGTNPGTPVMWAEGRTKDLWTETNEEWERCNTFAELLAGIAPIKE